MQNYSRNIVIELNIIIIQEHQRIMATTLSFNKSNQLRISKSAQIDISISTSKVLETPENCTKFIAGNSIDDFTVIDSQGASVQIQGNVTTKNTLKGSTTSDLQIRDFFFNSLNKKFYCFNWGIRQKGLHKFSNSEYESPLVKMNSPVSEKRILSLNPTNCDIVFLESSYKLVSLELNSACLSKFLLFNSHPSSNFIKLHSFIGPNQLLIGLSNGDLFFIAYSPCLKKIVRKEKISLKKVSMFYKLSMIEVSPDNRFIALFYKFKSKLISVFLLENKGFGQIEFLHQLSLDRENINKAQNPYFLQSETEELLLALPQDGKKGVTLHIFQILKNEKRMDVCRKVELKEMKLPLRFEQIGGKNLGIDANGWMVKLDVC